MPKIAVAEFLDMAGIRFHDNMPVQRRHTMGPEALTMTLPDGSMGPIPDDGERSGRLLSRDMLMTVAFLLSH